MSPAGWLTIAAVLVASVWWIVARNRGVVGLSAVSLLAIALAGISIAVDAMRWQLVPWALLAFGMGTAATVAMWRPGRSRRWKRTLGTIGLVLGLLLGGIALLTGPVPSLASPTGPYHVASEIFRWTDGTRPETATEDPHDRREVIAQAWYPTDATAGTAVPYLEAQGELPGAVAGLPPWFFGAFDEVDTHAVSGTPVSSDRAVWPLVIFSPGLGNPRELSTSLCVDLASRGFVVVALTHPYESAVAVLGDGTVVGQTVTPAVAGPSHVTELSNQIDVRTADATFALDRLTRLADDDPDAPIAGHLDVVHVAMIGHSLGGATAARVLADDHRFVAGVDLDGKVFEPASERLDAPFLWVQSDVRQQEEYTRGRDALLNGLRAGGLLVTVGGSQHMTFSDAPSYVTSLGRALLGSALAFGSLSVDDATSETSDLITAFLAPYVSGPTEPTMRAVLSSHPSITVDRRIAPEGTG